MKGEKVELMAPAGSFAALQAAIDNGADSVYFGVDQLNMRARATMNFTLGDLEEISQRCAEKGLRTYLTLNTIIYDHDLSIVKKVVNEVKKHNITAVIASDQAVISYARSQDVEVHISTQLNVTNLETVKFYSHYADTMVLSRELSVSQMKVIADGIAKENITGPSGNLVEVEVFAHGALCMAVSGKCYLSLHTQNSSANRGACIQNCRRTYKVVDLEDGHELEIDSEYIMSPKDLCTIDFLDILLDTGVKVLKIEGRGRAPEYVATVIKCYREAIDAYYADTYTQDKVDNWMKELHNVYNRGFWSGYYLGQKMGEWTKKSGSSANTRKVYLGKGVHYFPKAGVAQFKMEAQELKVGDDILIQGPTTGSLAITVEAMRVDDKDVEKAVRGEDVTMVLNETIRPSDKLYKVVSTQQEAATA